MLSAVLFVKLDFCTNYPKFCVPEYTTLKIGGLPRVVSYKILSCHQNLALSNYFVKIKRIGLSLPLTKFAHFSYSFGLHDKEQILFWHFPKPDAHRVPITYIAAGLPHS